MEAPLATARLLEDKDIAGVACLGIIEKGRNTARNRNGSSRNPKILSISN